MPLTVRPGCAAQISRSNNNQPLPAAPCPHLPIRDPVLLPTRDPNRLRLAVPPGCAAFALTTVPQARHMCRTS